MRRLTVGTRGSALALSQTQIVLEALKAASPGLDVEIRTLKTEGDARQEVRLDEIGGQGVFVKDIERALIAGEIDFAVHSLKDMPAETPAQLTIVAVLERGDARDALVATGGRGLSALPSGARIGTDSRRRALQLRALRPDVEPTSIRGNVDSRVRKAESGDYDAVCLAVAGLERLRLLDKACQIFTLEEMLPAVGQAVLAVESRMDDMEVLDILRPIDHLRTRIEITAERAYLRRLGAGCLLPVAALAVLQKDEHLRLRALLGTDDGRLFRAELGGPYQESTRLGEELADLLLGRAGPAHD